jgi:quinol monooxygenase YgiN
MVGHPRASTADDGEGDVRHITLIVEFAIKPGKLADFESAASAMREMVQRDEPGTLRYDWWLSDDGGRDINIEVFVDSDALVTHMGNTGSLLPGLLACADVVRVEVLGDLTQAGHAAIDDAATGTYGLLGGITR